MSAAYTSKDIFDMMTDMHKVCGGSLAKEDMKRTAKSELGAVGYLCYCLGRGVPAEVLCEICPYEKDFVLLIEAYYK